MESLWESTAKLPSFGQLDKDITTDVLIIGGGMAGILCAYTLKATGVDCIIAEAGTVCRGTTGNTTAKITSQHGLIYDRLISEYGKEKARKYLLANDEALNTYRKMCRNIDCDFENRNSYVYSTEGKSRIAKEITALQSLGSSACFSIHLPLPFPVAGAVCFKNQAQFNPMKFVSHIMQGLEVYEHTRVTELIGTTAVTEHGRIKANRIIATTHFPLINKHGGYFVKMYQHRSYVIALENAGNVCGMYVDSNKKGMSFRNYNNLLLIGGGGHRTGKHGGNWDELRDFAARYFPKAKEKYHWAAQDCMTLDGVPYIGRYSRGTENLYVATGFNKWGMTSSMVAAKILTDSICGRNNRYADVFSPSRSFMHPQLAANAFEAVAGLAAPTAKRCPHLGCALKWNSAEHTWDCSCHGSRFDSDGKVLDNPANGDMKK